MRCFRTLISFKAPKTAIDYQDSLLSIGSCFAQNIGKKLAKYKFQTLSNPFGILYNPISICHTLECLIQEKKYTQVDIFQHQELWHSFDHHSQFSTPCAGETLRAINQASEQASVFIKKTNRLLITLGTAAVFFHKENKQIVANCHKLPAVSFERRRLGVVAMYERLYRTLQLLKKVLPELEVIMTVSPIRHIRDGLLENQRSKARLLLTIEQLEENLDFVHYFPAYEMLLDDLRDYRFYEADMIHPNQVAIDYVWEAFQQQYFKPQTQQILGQIQKIIAASEHRAFNPNTMAHQQFLKKQIEKIKHLEAQYNFLDFAKEKEKFSFD